MRDTMRVYQLMARDKRAEALSKLAKVMKISHAEPAAELFCDQPICLAARGRNKYVRRLSPIDVYATQTDAASVQGHLCACL